MKVRVFATVVWLSIVVIQIVLDATGISILSVHILKLRKFIWGRINYEIFLNDNEVTLGDLKQALGNLDYGPPDGVTYETLALDNIDNEGNLHFIIEVGSMF
jgi:hypothetical protein